jgi:hypothetical protein
METTPRSPGGHAPPPPARRSGRGSAARGSAGAARVGDGARRGRRFHPLRSILAEIYLCHTSSCHEILRTETPGRAAVRTGGVGARIITCRKHRCSAAGVTAEKGKAGAERAAVAAGHQCGGIGVERRLHILVGAAGRSDQLGGARFNSWAGRVLSVEREGGGILLTESTQTLQRCSAASSVLGIRTSHSHAPSCSCPGVSTLNIYFLTRTGAT